LGILINHLDFNEHKGVLEGRLNRERGRGLHAFFGPKAAAEEGGGVAAGESAAAASASAATAAASTGRGKAWFD
jgi:hypothetical protein